MSLTVKQYLQLKARITAGLSRVDAGIKANYQTEGNLDDLVDTLYTMEIYSVLDMHREAIGDPRFQAIFSPLLKQQTQVITPLKVVSTASVGVQSESPRDIEGIKTGISSIGRLFEKVFLKQERLEVKAKSKFDIKVTSLLLDDITKHLSGIGEMQLRINHALDKLLHSHQQRVVPKPIPIVVEEVKDDPKESVIEVQQQADTIVEKQEQVVLVNAEEGQGLPSHLGIDLSADKNLNFLLRDLLDQMIGPLKAHCKLGEMRVMLDTFRELWVTGSMEHLGWRQPDNYQIVTFNINRDEQRLHHDRCRYFEEHVTVPIKIEAILLVPDVILTGICFPDFPVEFRYPHANLLYGGSQSTAQSFDLMRAVKAQYPYSKAYSDLKDSGAVRQSMRFIGDNIVLNGVEHPCYFLVLEKPLLIAGRTKVYF